MEVPNLQLELQGYRMNDRETQTVFRPRALPELVFRIFSYLV